LPERVGDVPPREGAVVSDLIDCQKTVERMLSDGGTLPEVEGYVERCALDEMEKAGLWMLASQVGFRGVTGLSSSAGVAAQAGWSSFTS